MVKVKKSKTKNLLREKLSKGRSTSNRRGQASAANRAKKEEAQTSLADNESMLKDLFLDELRDIYWAEKHLVKTLPKLQKAATSQQLATAFEDHLAVTQDQVTRLEQIFDLLGEKARGKKCEGMEGLTKEGESVISDTEKGTSTRDAGLIISAQKVEHYEIAAYGGLATLARTLGEDQIASILGEILEEEKEADELLTNIAEGSINQSAEAE